MAIKIKYTTPSKRRRKNAYLKKRNISIAKSDKTKTGNLSLYTDHQNQHLRSRYRQKDTRIGTRR